MPSSADLAILKGQMATLVSREICDKPRRRSARAHVSVGHFVLIYRTNLAPIKIRLAE